MRRSNWRTTGALRPPNPDDEPSQRELLPSTRCWWRPSAVEKPSEGARYSGSAVTNPRLGRLIGMARRGQDNRDKCVARAEMVTQ